ncbi:MAG: PKD domain-containing protein [Saprospiraceae bacterium]|nr:PKD domain-containing protein [Saprospiraceae bacterium]
MQNNIYKLKFIRIKLILLLIFISVFGFSQQLSQVHVRGTITNTTDGLPISNKLVQIIISDSLGGANQDLYSNSNGYFEDVFIASPIDGVVIVYVYDCDGNVSSQVFSFTGNTTLTANFVICHKSPKNCNAYFTSELDTAYPMVNLFHFTDSSTASDSIISWNWDFGDGQTSTAQDTHHIYYFPGIYNVCLNIQTTEPCSSTYCHTVNASNTGSDSCNADFTYQPHPTNPLGYYFFDNSTVPAPAFLADWVWIFGDGDSSTLASPYHEYGQKGIYEVKYGIVTSDTCVDLKVDTIYVDTIMSNTCQAAFQFVHDTTSSHPYEVDFTDNSNAPGSSVVSWYWYFDDGTADTLQHPTHQYLCAGIYKVKLTILTADLCSSTLIQEINVGNPKKYILGGHVFSGLYPPIDTGIAYLYKAYGNFIVPIDTMTFGSFGFYYFIDVYEGFYKVKVAPLPSSIYYNSNAPTYYSDKLLWLDASPIFLNSYNIAMNVHLIGISPSTGSGSISGFVTQGSKGQKTASQIENVEILLLDMSGNPVKYTYTNSSGDFSFTNLAFGTYDVYAEATGLYTNPVEVTLNQSNPNVSGVILQVKDSSITGVVYYDYNPITSIGNIYPNPIDKNINIEFDVVSTTSFNISIFDIIGRKIINEEIILGSGAQTINIPVDYLKAGIYILDIKSKDGSVSKTQKIIK